MPLLERPLTSATEVDRIARFWKRAISLEVGRSEHTSFRGPTQLTQAQNAEIAALYISGWRPADVTGAIAIASQGAPTA